MAVKSSSREKLNVLNNKKASRWRFWYQISHLSANHYLGRLQGILKQSKY